MEGKKTAVSLQLMCRGIEVYLQREKVTTGLRNKQKVLKFKALKDF